MSIEDLKAMASNPFDDPSWDDIEEDEEKEVKDPEIVYLEWSWTTLRADKTPYKVYGHELQPIGSINVLIPVPYAEVADFVEEPSGSYKDCPVYHTLTLTVEGMLYVEHYLAQHSIEYFEKRR